MTKTTLRRTLPLLLAAAAAACASGARRGPASAGGPRPAWVDGESPDYPRSGYVLGVGSADDENTAAERARGEVARVFSADVSVLSSVAETETNIDQSHSFSQSVSDNVRSATKKVLEGVDIVARWKDSSTSRYYALAALEKGKAMEAVEEKTKAIDADSAQWKARMDAATDKFERAKAAAKLATLIKGRLDLENDRRVLGGGPLPSSVDAAAAKASAAQALAALDVLVSADGDGASEVVTGVVDGLNAAGLSAKRGAPADAADLSAQARVAVAPMEGDDPRWKWSRATATVTLQDARAGKAFARFELSDREASADAGEARRRALVALAKKVSAQVASAVNDFFANQ